MNLRPTAMRHSLNLSTEPKGEALLCRNESGFLIYKPVGLVRGGGLNDKG